MLKLHKLFLNEGHANSFNEVIKPLEDERRALVRAKNLIRDHLRSSIRSASTKVLEQSRVIEPRFRTQGSWAYATCVRPAHLPPQEMDWDFGVYLPVTVWSENGPPHAMARLYFDLVESALQSLCDREGWTLDRTKPSCSRVRIAWWGHIDVPLYAAPEEEFLRVAEKTLSKGQLRARFRDLATLEEDETLGELWEAKWDFVDCLHMARRDGSWKRTDPEAVAVWFEDRVNLHTEQLRRVCRYLKAWRDFLWPKEGGPSSVAIMIAVAQSFEQAWHRDDLALEKAAAALGRALAGDIREHGIDAGEEDFNRLSAEERRAAAQNAANFASQLRLARSLSMNLVRDAVEYVRAHLGPRVPSDPSLIEEEGSADGVRLTAAAAVTPPIVGSTSAG